MSTEYKELKSLVFETVGFELPEQVPEIGKQFAIPLPNIDVQPKDKNTALCVYLGGSEVLIQSEVEEYIRTDREVYHFGTSDTNLTEYRLKAHTKRKAEKTKQAIKEYELAKCIRSEGHPLLKGMGFESLPYSNGLEPNEDWVPNEGMGFGELKSNNETVLQVFYSWGIQGENELKDNPHITAIRKHALDGVKDSVDSSEILPSFHVHQLSRSTAVMWTIGLENALKLKRNNPDFTIVEAYSIKHLYQGINNKDFFLRRGWHRPTHLIGLPSRDLKQFNALAERKRKSSFVVPKQYTVSTFEITKGGVHE